ncbi:PhzF family phenazine biosynthesis protein [bacterium]|nr:PhzF family phenazine biosynthesis protein [bacterium]
MSRTAPLELDFVQLDVFTDTALGGNPLAVFPQPGDIDSATMLALARETNLSETTFICGRDEAAHVYDVRIFTPTQEMLFAGHPVVGTAWQIFQQLPDDVQQIHLRVPAGLIPVWIERRASAPALISFAPPPVEARQELSDPLLLSSLCRLSVDDLDLGRAPAQVLLTGPRYLLIPVRDRAALERATYDSLLLREFDHQYGADQLTLFCFEPYREGSLISTRMFAPFHGVPEDPATGSSAVCLAHYLRAQGLVDDSGEDWFGIDQGYSLSRPSLILARANMQNDGSIEIRIGGQVVPVAEGKYRL